jgi:tripartite-type tricarboxylate transporter receptor subunit TctC
MGIARRKFLQLAAGAVVLPATPGVAVADTYPSRPIRLVLPFPPGGAFDIIGRPWADKVKSSLGTVVVDNQPGAGGSLAAQIVAHATPDGYTVFLGASSIHLTEMILREHPLLDPNKELTPVAMIALTCFAITVHPSVPVHTLMELIDYIKANPGKVSYGSAGAGTMNHLSGELLKSLTGIKDLPHVPYRGSGPGMADLVGGQIPVYIAAMTSQVLEFHRTGKLRLLAITNDKRLPVCPDIPTAAESGVPELVTTQVIGIFVPAGTPAQAIAQLDTANATALTDKSYQQALTDAAFIPLIGWTPEKFNQYMAKDVARWSPLVKSIGLKLD